MAGHAVTRVLVPIDNLLVTISAHAHSWIHRNAENYCLLVDFCNPSISLTVWLKLSSDSPARSK
ncbi:TPA: hypothetical protein ACGBSZ_000721 [Salmonella enterica subsp. enterica serovar Dublin]